jgi:phthalate 3,4-dioxygenase ferredoxin reductase component
LRGAVTINWPKALVSCRRLMAAGATYDAALAGVRALPQSAVPR